MSAIGVGLIARGIGVFRSWCRRGDYAKHLEQRAEQLGLPTDPEAYQDGGLVVAATAYRPQDAEVLAGILRGAGVPAWVRSPFSAITLWHIQPGARPGGVAVLVPLGRLKDAQAILAEPEDALEAEEAFDEDLHSEQLARWARALFSITLGLYILAPYCLVRSILILREIRRVLERSGPSPDLAAARRWAIATAVLSMPYMAVVLSLWW